MEKLSEKYCKELGGINLHELYPKINILIGMVDSNEYIYTLRMISDLNNIGLNAFELSIAHNNKTGNQKYTYLIYSQDYEIKNLNEVLDFLDAELHETSYGYKNVIQKIIIKNPQKEKQLYQDEIIYKKTLSTYKEEEL